MSTGLAAAEAQLDKLRAAAEWDAVATLLRGWESGGSGAVAGVSDAHPTPSHVTAYRHTVAGEVAMHGRRYGDARKALCKALVALPSYVDALVLLSRLNVVTGVWPPEAEAPGGSGGGGSGGAGGGGGRNASRRVPKRHRLQLPHLHLPALPFMKRLADAAPARPGRNEAVGLTEVGMSGDGPAAGGGGVGMEGVPFDTTDNLELLLRARDAALGQVEHATQYRFYLRVSGLHDLCRLHEEGYLPATPTGVATIHGPGPDAPATAYTLAPPALCLLYAAATVDALWCMIATYVGRKYRTLSPTTTVSLGALHLATAGPAPPTNHEEEVALLSRIGLPTRVLEGGGPLVFSAVMDAGHAGGGDGIATAGTITTVARAVMVGMGRCGHSQPPSLSITSLFCTSEEVGQVTRTPVHVIDPATLTMPAPILHHLSAPYPPAAMATTLPGVPLSSNMVAGGGSGGGALILPPGRGSPSLPLPSPGTIAMRAGVGTIVTPSPASSSSTAPAGATASIAPLPPTAIPPTATGGGEWGAAATNRHLSHIDARSREEAAVCFARLPLILHRLGDTAAAVGAYRACLDNDGPIAAHLAGTVKDALVEGLLLAELEGAVAPPDMGHMSCREVVGDGAPVPPSPSSPLARQGDGNANAGAGASATPPWCWALSPPTSFQLPASAVWAMQTTSPTSPTLGPAGAPFPPRSPAVQHLVSGHVGDVMHVIMAQWWFRNPALRCHLAATLTHPPTPTTSMGSAQPLDGGVSVLWHPTLVHTRARRVIHAATLVATARPRSRGAWSDLAVGMACRLMMEVSTVTAATRRRWQCHLPTTGFATMSDVTLPQDALDAADLVPYSRAGAAARRSSGGGGEDEDKVDSEGDGSSSSSRERGGDQVWWLPPAATATTDIVTPARLAALSAYLAAVEEAVSLSVETRSLDAVTTAAASPATSSSGGKGGAAPPPSTTSLSSGGRGSFEAGASGGVAGEDGTGEVGHVGRVLPAVEGVDGVAMGSDGNPPAATPNAAHASPTHSTVPSTATVLTPTAHLFNTFVPDSVLLIQAAGVALIMGVAPTIALKLAVRALVACSADTHHLSPHFHAIRGTMALSKHRAQALWMQWRRDHLAACYHVLALALLTQSRQVGRASTMHVGTLPGSHLADTASDQPGVTRRLAVRAFAACRRGLDALCGGLDGPVLLGAHPSGRPSGTDGPTTLASAMDFTSLDDGAPLTGIAEVEEELDATGMLGGGVAGGEGSDADLDLDEGLDADDEDVGLDDGDDGGSRSTASAAGSFLPPDDVVGDEDGPGDHDGGGQATAYAGVPSLGKGDSVATVINSSDVGGEDGMPKGTSMAPTSRADGDAALTPLPDLLSPPQHHNAAVGPPHPNATRPGQEEATDAAPSDTAALAASGINPSPQGQPSDGPLGARAAQRRPTISPGPAAMITEVYPLAPTTAWPLLYHAACACHAAGDAVTALRYATRSVQLADAAWRSGGDVADNDGNAILPWLLAASLASEAGDLTAASTLLSSALARRPDHVLLRLAECRVLELVNLRDTVSMAGVVFASVPVATPPGTTPTVSGGGPPSLAVASNVSPSRLVDMYIDVARGADALAWSFLHACWTGCNPEAAGLAGWAVDATPVGSSASVLQSHDIGRRGWGPGSSYVTPLAVRLAVAAHVASCRYVLSQGQLELAMGTLIAADALLEACGAPVHVTFNQAPAGHAAASGSGGPTSPLDSPHARGMSFLAPGSTAAAPFVTFASPFTTVQRAAVKFNVPIDAALRADVIATAGLVQEALGAFGRAEAHYTAALAIHAGHVPSLQRMAELSLAGAVALATSDQAGHHHGINHIVTMWLGVDPLTVTLPPVPAGGDPRDDWFRLDRAKAYAQSAVQHAPTNPAAWLTLSRVHTAAGDHDAAADAALTAWHRQTVPSGMPGGGGGGQPLLPAHLLPLRLPLWLC